MVHYYEKDYEVKYDESEFDPAAGLSIKDSPSAIKLAVDLWCDKISKEYLQILYPEFGFVGEESFDSNELKKEYFWCVDPICGSIGYKKKTDYFGTSIALIKRGEGPFIGVLTCPKLKIAGIASLPEKKAFYSGKFKRYKTEGLKVIVSSNRRKDMYLEKMLRILKPEIVDYQESVPTKSLQVLGGTYDLHFNLPAKFGGATPKIWDLAASYVFYKIEGMKFVDFNGNEIDLTGTLKSHRYPNGYIMAKNEEILQRCLWAFNQIKP
jgi:fructose-1,6-bisphosphatase/inositol monophosphatase family enzyme